LSPYLFAIYIDSVFEKVAATRVGCHVKWACASILMYADDVLLLAPVVQCGLCTTQPIISQNDPFISVQFVWLPLLVLGLKPRLHIHGMSYGWPRR